MPVYFDGHNIIPGPFVEIIKEFVRSEDGKVRRRFFTITAKGKLVSYAGSPRSDGTWWSGGIANPPPLETVTADQRLAAIKKKQAALIDIFKVDHKAFEIQPFDGSAPIKFYPRIKSITFPEGKWTETCDYVIAMEADQIWWGSVEGGGGTDDLEPEESWSYEIEQGDLRVYRVSHTVNSQQKAEYDETGTLIREGWEVAKGVVEPFLGDTPPPNMLPDIAAGYVACDYSRSQTADMANGRFSVTENWIYTGNQRYTEDFTVNCRIQEGLTTVTIEGTITGHIPPDPNKSAAQASTDKFAKAKDVWENTVQPDLLSRAQNYSGTTLNPIVANQTVGFNPIKGVITYTMEYDNRAPNLVAGSISETISVQQQNPTDVMAQLVVLGRAAGPIFQPIGTVTARVRTVSVEVVMPRWLYNGSAPVAPNVLGVILQYYPGGMVSKDDENWSVTSGRYSRSVAWTY